jgi:hypothetical protein
MVKCVSCAVDGYDLLAHAYVQVLRFEHRVVLIFKESIVPYDLSKFSQQILAQNQLQVITNWVQYW